MESVESNAMFFIGMFALVIGAALGVSTLIIKGKPNRKYQARFSLIMSFVSVGAGVFLLFFDTVISPMATSVVFLVAIVIIIAIFDKKKKEENNWE